MSGINLNDFVGGAREEPEAGRPRSQLRAESVGVGDDPRLPICLLLDASYSIERAGRTADLRGALERWPLWLRSDPELRNTLEVAVIVFGPNHQATIVDPAGGGSPFMTVDGLEIPEITPDGTTPLAEALSIALRLCHDRMLALNGMPSRRPRLIVVSDGEPTDATGAPDHTTWRAAASQIRTATENRKLFCIGLAIGHGAREVLAEFADPVLAIDGPFDELLKVVTLSTYYDDPRRGLKSFAKLHGIST